MSLRIDEYLSRNGVLGVTAAQAVSAAANSADVGKKEGDSYISSVSSAEEAIPSENYNDILKVIRSAKEEGNETATSSETASDSGVSSSGSVSGAGGGDAGSDEETTTEIVTINGVTYLQTTTVSDGVTSVERTVISGDDKQE